MEQRSLFLNLSPLDHRYYLSNRDLFDRLGACLSEEASVRYAVRCEVALLKAHLDLHFAAADRPALLEALERSSPTRSTRRRRRPSTTSGPW